MLHGPSRRTSAAVEVRRDPDFVIIRQHWLMPGMLIADVRG